MKQVDDLRERLLVHAAASGKPGAFEKLLDRYEPRIYNLALRMLGGDRAEAEDATQEALIAVYRNLAGFRGASRFDTWLHRIAVNVCLQRRRKHAELGAPMDAFTYADEPGSDPSSDPLNAVLRSELNLALTDCVAKLPEAQQTVVLLHGMQGFTYSEVASILDCPVGTVKSRLSAAFTHIRANLSGYMAAEPVASITSSTSQLSAPIPEVGR